MDQVHEEANETGLGLRHAVITVTRQQALGAGFMRAMRHQLRKDIAGRDVMDALRRWTAVLGFGVFLVCTVLPAGVCADETGSPETTFEITEGLVDWQVLQRGDGRGLGHEITSS